MYPIEEESGAQEALPWGSFTFPFDIDASKFALIPGKGALDDPAFILRYRLRVLRPWPFTPRDVGFNAAAFLQMPTQPQRIISFVGIKRFRFFMELIKKRLDLFAFINICRGCFDRQGFAVGIDDGMNGDALAFIAIGDKIAAALTAGKKSRPPPLCPS